MKPVLRVTDLAKSFGRHAALAGVTFSVHPGEMVGLLGPNGAGKTTLASLIAGLLAPDSGDIELFGTSLEADRSGALAKLGVVFQSRSLDLEMTVKANLKFHAALFGIGGSAAAARIDELAALLDFEQLLGKAVRTLSGGNERRVEIARALLNRPRLVLMDEATTGLDAAARPALLAHVRDLCRNEQTAVLWATHLLDEVDTADRVIVLNNGRVNAIGTPPEIISRAGATTLVDAYLALAEEARPATQPP